MNDMLDEVYYIPERADHSDGAPVRIDLNPDGSANLTRLPKKLREDFEAFGFPNPMHTDDVMPADGASFILALLYSKNPYYKFLRRTDLNA